MLGFGVPFLVHTFLYILVGPPIRDILLVPVSLLEWLFVAIAGVGDIFLVRAIIESLVTRLRRVYR
jgi:hypothetical protein